MGHETLVDAIKLKKEEFSCCSTRLEDLNLFVLIKMVLNGKISYKIWPLPKNLVNSCCLC